MQVGSQNAPVSKKRLWAGRIISGLAVLMLLFSGVMKLMRPVAVVEEFGRLGYPRSHRRLGILELILCCSLLD